MLVALIYPLGEDEPSLEEWAFLPLGLVYLATYLKKHLPAVDVMIHDERVNGSSDLLIEREKPDIVGLTVTGWNQKRSYKIAQLAKTCGARVILGGVQATALAPQILRHRPFVDAICRGEGERGLLGFVSNEALHAITNLVFREGPKVVTNPVLPVPWSENPTPNRSLIKQFAYLNKYKSLGGDGRPTNIVTHRGCHYRDQTKAQGCVFCASPGLEFNSRFRPVEAVSEEVKSVIDGYGITWIRDYGEAMTPRFLSMLVAEISESIADMLPKVCFEFYMRVTDFTPETARCLRAINGSVIFGIESGSPATLRSARKGYGFGQLENAVNLADREGISCQYNLVLGLPGETPQTLEETLTWCRSLPSCFRLKQASILVPVPGSMAFEWVRQTPEFLSYYGPEADIFNWEVLQDIWVRNFTKVSLPELWQASSQFQFLGRTLRTSPGI